MDYKSQKPRMTEEEKQFLLQIVETYKDVILSKSTDALNISKKKSVWFKLTNEFNRQPNHTERTVAQLQKALDNIKTKRKKQLCSEKRARLATGGGTAQEPAKDDLADRVLSQATDIEISDTIDSDTVMLSAGPSTSRYIVNDDDMLMPTYENIQNEVEAVKPPKTKQKLLTARQEAIKAEKEFRLQKAATILEEERELYCIKKMEANVRLEIANEELKEAQIRTSTAEMNKEYQEKINELKLKYEIKRYEGN